MWVMPFSFSRPARYIALEKTNRSKSKFFSRIMAITYRRVYTDRGSLKTKYLYTARGFSAMGHRYWTDTPGVLRFVSNSRQADIGDNQDGRPESAKRPLAGQSPG